MRSPDAVRLTPGGGGNTIPVMRIVDLSNVQRKKSPILYRREFKADAVFEVMEETLSSPVEFVLEHQALGGIDVRITIVDDVDCPLMPLVAALKSRILELDRQGNLP